MGTFDDSTPKVRPLGEDTPPTPSRSLPIAGAIFVAIVASSAFFLSNGPNDVPPLPRSPLVSLPTTTITTASTEAAPPPPSLFPSSDDLEINERTAQLLDGSMAIWDAVPEARGDLVALIGGPTGTDLIRVGSDGSVLLFEKLNRASDVAFDRSGRLLAYTADSRIVNGPVLYVESVSIAEADSFAWHTAVPGRIAWLAPGSDAQLCWADIVEPGEFPTANCASGPGFGFQLVAFDDEGFIFIDRAGQSIVRLGQDRQRVAGMAGDHVMPGPRDRLTVVDGGSGAEVMFTVDGRDFTNPQRLDWAPFSASTTPAVAAWSPSMVYPEIAFLTWNEDHYELQVYDLDGRLNHAVDIAGMPGGLEWDSTGRYLLIPGTVNNAHHLYIYDTFEERQLLADVPMGGWINEAVLVTPTQCTDADRIVSAWARQLPNGVTLWPAQMVLSRDAYLLGFTFVSARVIGGNFDGETATWALPSFVPDNEALPVSIMAVNETAAALGVDNTALPDPDSDWIGVHGVLDSQHCLTNP
ncbi:MAG: hypothetical protein OEY98_02245 [Acidimicrobiia bacterium]|nr:hypothetical protein [Acidimicrobiia bacterium]